MSILTEAGDKVLNKHFFWAKPVYSLNMETSSMQI